MQNNIVKLDEYKEAKQNYEQFVKLMYELMNCQSKLYPYLHIHGVPYLINSLTELLLKLDQYCYEYEKVLDKRENNE